MSDAQPVSVSSTPIIGRRRAMGGSGGNGWPVQRAAGDGRVGRSSVFSCDGIVAEVRAYVVAHVSGRIEAGVLAGATGVSAKVLRRLVVSGTGMRLAQFVLSIRLDEARGWLSSNRESRSLRQIAQALGFQSHAAFGRAYRRRFGEGMSETRRRAVRMGEALASAELGIGLAG